MHVDACVEVLVESEHRGAAAHDGHRGLNRFLHHVAELTGLNELALARHDRRLDREQLAADFGPRKPGDLADLIVLLRAPVTESTHAEVLSTRLRVIDAHHVLARLQQQLLDDLAADVRDLALEVADAGLARVVANDVEDRRIGNLELAVA